MALRRVLSKRLFTKNKSDSTSIVVHSPISFASHNPANAAFNTNFQREFLSSPDSTKSGFFRRFLEQRRTINQAGAARLPEFLSIPVGDKLRENLRSMNIAGERLRLDGLVPPSPTPEKGFGGMSVADARKILRRALLEKVRLKLREIPTNSLSYYDFVKVCGDVCENRKQGLEFAKTLDESGDVIVLGNVVFLRPDQVAKSMEKMINESIGMPNDPRRRELEELEKKKAVIDEKARSLVKGELYCGLGFLVMQTLGFMRLTFWELSWDVMEPICFFVTSLHFALAYGFFLRTSKEPSFEGYFQRRFGVKQRKLMKVHNFDVEKYNQLRHAFYPAYYNDHARGPVSGSMHG